MVGLACKSTTLLSKVHTAAEEPLHGKCCSTHFLDQVVALVVGQKVVQPVQGPSTFSFLHDQPAVLATGCLRPDQGVCSQHCSWRPADKLYP